METAAGGCWRENWRVPAPFWRAPHVPRVRPSRGALDGDLAEIVIPQRRGSCGTRGQLPAGRREGRDPDAVPEHVLDALSLIVVNVLPFG